MTEEMNLEDKKIDKLTSEFFTASSKADFYDSIFNKLNENFEKESCLVKTHNKEEYWDLPGFCEFCKEPVLFRVDKLYTLTDRPNFRERMVCSSCSLNSRQRALASYVMKLIPSAGTFNIYLQEQITSFARLFKDKVLSRNSDTKVSGSEFLGYDKLPGTVHSGIRHENLMGLSFSESLFNLIISNDVLEHVLDINKSLNECYRVLGENGVMLITVPFHMGFDKSIQRVRMRNGSMEYLLPQLYHANPVGKNEGALVIWDFGWDFIDLCHNAGFRNVKMICCHSVTFGYLGDGLIYFFELKK